MNIENVEELVVNLPDKTEYVIHMRNLKKTLNYRLVSKKVQRVTKFNQNAKLKPWIDMDRDLRKKQIVILKVQLLEKRWKIWENIEILNLSKQKEEETIWCQNQIIILQSFSHKIC